MFTEREQGTAVNKRMMRSDSSLGSREIGMIEQAVASLRHTGGADVQLLSAQPAATPVYDADIEIAIKHVRARYAVECKNQVDRRLIAQQVKQRLQTANHPGLLIAPYISREIARYCRDIGLEFMDTHGNAYLTGHGLFVFVAGERLDSGMQTTTSKGSVTSVTGLRVAFALLSQPALAHAPYRNIAKTAGVSLGAVSNALEELERRGHLIQGSKPSQRTLLDPQRLMDEWTLAYPILLRPKLNIRRYSVTNEHWWEDGPWTNLGGWWSGDVAAERMTGYLKPTSQTIYVEPEQRAAWMKALITSQRAKPDPNGSIEVLDKFWDAGLDAQPGHAPALLVYADLVGTLDPRAQEAAQLIRQDYIDAAVSSS